MASFVAAEGKDSVCTQTCICASPHSGRSRNHFVRPVPQTFQGEDKSAPVAFPRPQTSALSAMKPPRVEASFQAEKPVRVRGKTLIQLLARQAAERRVAMEREREVVGLAANGRKMRIEREKRPPVSFNRKPSRGGGRRPIVKAIVINTGTSLPYCDI